MPRNGCDGSSTTGSTSSGIACGGGTSNASNGGGGSGCDGCEGCIYPDEVIMEKGVAFNVRYTGCVEVKTPMKSLDFSTRTQVARECINRVCEAAGLKSAGKRRIDKKILHYISDRPIMQNAGTNVIINVSSSSLSLVNVETGEVIASHNMPNISFASGGDSDTLHFLAYVAKNENEWRACYVLECIGGQSEDLIFTIGKAFMLRYNAINRKTHHPPENYNNPGKENEKDYYNDLPNKLPPDLLTDNDLSERLQKLNAEDEKSSEREQQQQKQQQTLSQQPQKLPQIPKVICQLNLKKPRDRLSSNLIDLNSPPPDQTTSKINLSNFDPMKEITGASASAGAGGSCGGVGGTTAAATTTNNQMPVRDVFDLPPYSLSAEIQRSQLLTESWFHTGLFRQSAENLLKNDGDFLVRESQGKQSQYVLTGLEGKIPKHLLLIDPEGVVRTKDRVYDSISHLINYHWKNALPIISEDSELVLRNPVCVKQQNNNLNNAK